MSRIAIIIGATRPNRFGPKAAEWIQGFTGGAAAEFSVIDLAEVDLPLFDEPTAPMLGKYQNAHTKAWAELVSGFDGFIIVTPEYNHGYPAALKNALDFLYAEWNHKPVAFVSYGAGAGGARAVEQLREVVVNLLMFPLNDHVSFVNYWSQLDENGNLNANDQQVAMAKQLVANIVLWSDNFKAIRSKMASEKA